MPKNHSGKWGIVCFLLIFVVNGCVVSCPDEPSPRFAWIMGVIFLFGATGFLGMAGGKGNFFSVLTSPENRYSLSRLQMLAWTILILPAFTTAVFWNIKYLSFKEAPPKSATVVNKENGQAGEQKSSEAGKSEIKLQSPMDIAFDPTLWSLMGIATTSLIGTPLILAGKKQIGVKPQQGAQGQQGGQPPQDNPSGESFEGTVVIKEKPSWIDLFHGEEAGNKNNVELAKVQMFYFTIITLIVYAISIGGMFSTYLGQIEKTIIESFPKIGDGMLGLIMISHAGYLTKKGIPNTNLPKS